MTVSEGAFQPYNGTVFILTGMLELDTSLVDTVVVLTWIWSLNGEELDRWYTNTLPHRITIPFNPLTTNSSGLYSLNVDVDPFDPAFIIPNRNSSTTYNLSVQSELLILITY